jgi:membrane associated rhomboid family serine protease
MLGGSLGALLLSSPEQFTIGASGAVYGLFAATLVIARDRGLNQVVTQLGFWLVLNLVITFTVPTISVGGHLGGLAAGALAALVVLAGERRGSGRKMLGAELATVGGLGIGLAVAAVALAGAGVYTTI